MLSKDTIEIWDISDNKIYVKLKESYRVSFLNCALHISGTVKNLAKLIRKKTFTFEKYRKGTISIPLRVVKDILNLLPKDESNYFKENLEANIEELKFGRRGIPIKGDILPIKFSLTLANIAGHLVGDGGISNRSLGISVYYSNQCGDLIQNFETILSNTFGIDSRIYIDKRDETKVIKYPSVVGLILMRFFGLQVGDEKHVPEIIINSDKSIKVEFLRALFDDESSVDVKGHLIRLGMANESIIEAVKSMLREFDIQPTKTVKISGVNGHKDRYEFSIVSRGDLRTFSEEISFDHPEKTRKLETLLNSYKSFQSRKGEFRACVIDALKGEKMNIFQLAEKLDQKSINGFRKELWKLERKGLIKSEIGRGKRNTIMKVYYV